jgi:hypothetical protein
VEYRYSCTFSLASALDGSELSTSHPGSFTPAKETRKPSYKWLVRPKAGLDK